MQPARDPGFTLVEVIMAVVLSSIIAGVTVAVMISSLNVVDTTRDLSRDSTDTGLIAAFLYRDAQAAGGTDPATLARDPSLGVSTTDWGSCEQPDGELVVRFAWVDRADVAAEHPMTVTWARFDDGRLVRRACQDKAVVEGAIGEHVGKVALTCQPGPACDATTTGITLDVRGSAEKTATTVTLTASMRPDLASLAAGGTGPEGPSSPLVLVGGAGVCPELSLGGVRTVVLGDVLVDDACGPKTVDGDGGSLQPTGALTPVSALRDPYAELVPDPVGCAGLPAAPSGTTVYPDAVTFSGTTTLSAGRHVFCSGFAVAGGSTLTGSGVFLQVVSGNLHVDHEATIDLTAGTSGAYRNLLLDVRAGDVVLPSGSAPDWYRGLVHAPASTVTIQSDVATAVGAIVADRLVVGGVGVVRVGMPIPAMTVAPATLATGQVGLQYTPTSLAATGGVGPYSWSATGLPDGLTLTAGGLLGGMPTSAGSFNPTIVATDSTGLAISVQRPVMVRAQLQVATPATMPSGQVGSVYASTTVTATGGTTPYSFSATGLPSGLVMSAAGVISGTPSAAGDFTVTVTASDAAGATATRSYTVAVRAALEISAPASLANGTVGTAWASTTVSAAGGTAPYSFSVSGLPPGLTMTTNGVISGTPTTAGTYAPVVTVTDSAGGTATRTYSITVAAAPATSTSAKPFAALRGFQIFTEGSTTLNTWEIAGAVATGGNLTFKNYERIARDETSALTVHSGGEPLGLLVGGSVDLNASGNGSELQLDNGWFVVGSATGQSFLKFSGELHLVPAGVKDDYTTPRVLSTDKQSDLATSQAVKPNIFDFAGAFTTLRSTSTKLAALSPTTCSAIATPTVTNTSGDTYTLTLTSGAVNVWNITVADMNRIANLDGNIIPGGTTKLIVNITDAGSVAPPTRYWAVLSNSSSASSIIWNFPNATSLTVSQTFFGSVMAPRAAVNLSNSNVLGDIVAKSLVFSAWSTNTAHYDTTIPCIG